ncbi:MAG: hypothetical protein ABIS39_05530 [Sphingomicrobium sp.]
MTRMFLEAPMWADEERDERGAGRALLCGLQQELGQMGFTIREGVESWDDYGWSLVIDHQGSSIWCMVQASDDWLIQSWPHSGLIDRLKGRDFGGPHREVMDAILAVLSRQRMLDGAQWLSETEVKAQ